MTRQNTKKTNMRKVQGLEGKINKAFNKMSFRDTLDSTSLFEFVCYRGLDFEAIVDHSITCLKNLGFGAIYYSGLDDNGSKVREPFYLLRPIEKSEKQNNPSISEKAKNLTEKMENAHRRGLHINVQAILEGFETLTTEEDLRALYETQKTHQKDALIRMGGVKGMSNGCKYVLGLSDNDPIDTAAERLAVDKMTYLLGKSSGWVEKKVTELIPELRQSWMVYAPQSPSRLYVGGNRNE